MLPDARDWDKAAATVQRPQTSALEAVRQPSQLPQIIVARAASGPTFGVTDGDAARAPAIAGVSGDASGGTFGQIDTPREPFASIDLGLHSGRPESRQDGARPSFAFPRADGDGSVVAPPLVAGARAHGAGASHERRELWRSNSVPHASTTIGAARAACGPSCARRSHEGASPPLARSISALTYRANTALQPALDLVADAELAAEAKLVGGAARLSPLFAPGGLLPAGSPPGVRLTASAAALSASAGGASFAAELSQLAQAVQQMAAEAAQSVGMPPHAFDALWPGAHLARSLSALHAPAPGGCAAGSLPGGVCPAGGGGAVDLRDSDGSVGVEASAGSDASAASNYIDFADLAVGMRVESKVGGVYSSAVVQHVDEHSAMLFYTEEKFDDWLELGALQPPVCVCVSAVCVSC